MSDRAPEVSIVTPTFDAAATLPRMFASVAAQRTRDWEHIVVDDGSSDDSVAIVAGHAARDRRIHLIELAHGGAAAARNRGLAAARGEWLLFLDADDTVARDHLVRMLRRLRAEPGADVVCCGYRRCAADGSVVAGYPAPDVAELDTLLAERPPTALHACLFRRTLLERLGGFDDRLATREDWELWRRLTRAGARIAVEPGQLADYWHSPGSLTRDGERLTRDTIAVAGDGSAALLRTRLWTGALAIGESRNTLPPAHATPPPEGLPATEELVDALLDGLMIGSGGPFAGLVARWAELHPPLARFLGELAAAWDAPGLDRALLRAAEAQAVRAGRISRTRMVGATLAVPLSRALFGGIAPPPGCEAVLIKTTLLRPRSLFLFAAPALAPLDARAVRALVLDRLREGIVTRAAERPGVARQLARAQRIVALASRLLHLPRTPRAADPASRSLAASIAAPILATRVAAPAPAPAAGGETPGGGTAHSWDAFFGTEDPWNYGSAYEQLKYRRTLDLIPADAPIGRALEVACAEGMFTRLLAPRVGRLRATDISEVALSRAAARCARADVGNVDFAVLDFFTRPLGGPWDLIVASEVLYYMAGAEGLDGFVAKLRDALAPGGLFLHAHAHLLSDEPERTGFDWGDPFGVATISARLHAADGLHLVRAVATELYTIELYRRADGPDRVAPAKPERLPLGTELERAVAECVVWNGAILTRDEAAAERAYTVPILMYHRIAEAGPKALAEWRTAPAEFEHQLRYLRRRGYRSVSIEEYEEARIRSGSLRGRPVLITFDDAYRDFAAAAWPILQRNGFSAHVFVVTGRVGAVAGWDAAAGAPAPLMDWDEIAAIGAHGVSFGSHLETHRAADRLSTAELFTEAVRSRATLEARLGVPITTLALPYGASDARVEELCVAAGYTRLFAAGGGMAQLCGPRLATPRIDVAGSDDIAAFAAKLGRRDEPPEPGDRP